MAGSCRAPNAHGRLRMLIQDVGPHTRRNRFPATDGIARHFGGFLFGLAALAPTRFASCRRTCSRPSGRSGAVGGEISGVTGGVPQRISARLRDSHVIGEQVEGPHREEADDPSRDRPDPNPPQVESSQRTTAPISRDEKGHCKGNSEVEQAAPAILQSVAVRDRIPELVLVFQDGQQPGKTRRTVVNHRRAVTQEDGEVMKDHRGARHSEKDSQPALHGPNYKLDERRGTELALGVGDKALDKDHDLLTGLDHEGLEIGDVVQPGICLDLLLAR